MVRTVSQVAFRFVFVVFCFALYDFVCSTANHSAPYRVAINRFANTDTILVCVHLFISVFALLSRTCCIPQTTNQINSYDLHSNLRNCQRKVETVFLDHLECVLMIWQNHIFWNSYASYNIFYCNAIKLHNSNRAIFNINS